MLIVLFSIFVDYDGDVGVVGYGNVGSDYVDLDSW